MKRETKPEPKRPAEIRCYADGREITLAQLARLIAEAGGIADKRSGK